MDPTEESQSNGHHPNESPNSQLDDESPFSSSANPRSIYQVEKSVEDGSQKKVILGIPLCVSKDIFNILWLDLCFFLIIYSFIGVQNLQSQLNATTGFVALGCLYTALSVSSLFCTPLVEKIGEKTSFVIGGIGYIVFMAANIDVIAPILWICAAANGAAAGIFWVAQGVYITRISNDENRQLYSSLFVASLGFSHIIANAITAILQLFPGFSFVSLFLLFTVCTGLGTLCFPALKRAPKNVEGVKSAVQLWKETFVLFKSSRLIPLWFFIISYGFNISFIFGAFPAQINDTHWSARALTVFGVFHLIMSLSASKLYKYMKRTLLVLINLIGMIIGTILAFYVGSPDRVWAYLLAAALFGTMEPTLLVQMFSIFGSEFPNELSQVNSVFRFTGSIASSFLFFISPFVGRNVIVGLVLAVEILGALGVFIQTYRRERYSFPAAPVHELETTNNEDFSN